MAIEKYDLIQLYRHVFGIDKYAPLPSRDYDSDGMSDLLGMPLFMPCKIEDYQLPNDPLIEINGSKNIVKTEIDGVDGTFKELFSINDYTITIRGIAVQNDGTDNYPEEMVRKIRKLAEAQKELRVVCKMLEYFNIDKLVVESCAFPAVEGYQDMQPYQLNCLSDKDFDLENLRITN